MRTFDDWQLDAKAAQRPLVELGEELRDRWSDWSDLTGYPDWETCCQAELGISAAHLRVRRQRAVAASIPTQRLDLPPAGPVTPEINSDEPDLVAAAVELAGQGLSYRKIGAALGVDESTVRRYPEVRAARVRADPDAHSTTNITNPLVCRIAPAVELIDAVKQRLSDLVSDKYTLTTKDRQRLTVILRKALEELDQ